MKSGEENTLTTVMIMKAAIRVPRMEQTKPPIAIPESLPLLDFLDTIARIIPGIERKIPKP